MRGSTQSSRTETNPLGYLALTAFLTILLLGITAGTSWYVKWRMHWTQETALIAYQAAKLDTEAKIDTIFLGDSSLGNAIDPQKFDRLTGTKSLNLATMGHLAFGSTYNMLRRALHKHPEIRNVVIMQFAPILAQPSAYRGFIMTAPDADLENFSQPVRWAIGRAFIHELLNWRSFLSLAKHLHQKQTLIFRDGYVKQKARRMTYHGQSNLAGDLRPDHDVFIAAIVGLCKAHKLNCLYANGPFAAPAIGPSRAFIAATASHLEKLGLRVAVPSPLPISPDKQGDTLNHIAPPYKGFATRYYAEKLRGFLKTAGPKD